MKIKKLKKKLKKLNSVDLHKIDIYVSELFILKIRKQLDKTPGRWDDKDDVPD